MIVTVFKKVTSASDTYNKSVLYCLRRIKEGRSKQTVEKIRKETDKDKRNQLKMQLPGVCFNGTFSHRSADGLIEHSGLCILDFDGFKEQDDAIAFRDSIASDEFIYSVWISPSGLGVKALVKIPKEPESHKLYFDALRDYFNSEHFDSSGSDVSRFCYESFDENIYINEDSKQWTVKNEPEIHEIGTDEPVIAVTSDNQIIDNLLKWWNSKFGLNNGERNNNVFKLVSAFNDFGISESECERVVMQFAESGFPENEIQKIVKSAYKRGVASFGTRFFEDKKSFQKIEKMIRSGKQTKDIVKKMNLKDESIIDDIKDSISVSEFWEYKGKNNTIQLSPHKFKFWLEQNNFFKFYPNETKSTFTFIRKEQNMLEETSEKKIKDYVLNQLLSNEEIGFKPYDFMASHTSYFSQEFLSFLETADVNIMEDSQNECYLYYQNTVVKVTKDSVEEIDYLDVNGYVWKRQIIERDFVQADHHESVFRRFLWLISGQDVERYNSFKSVIGYLLHSFKTSANNKAIIFNDEKISENPNGGSGKGLFWNALSKMKRVASIDGKTFDFGKSFPYQTVSTDTQILVFDDVRKNFNFESLFSLITEGITLEYKGQDAIKLPVQQSPKLIITTNYTVGGVGGSFERRKFEVEMSNYFGHKHTPLDEFGHLLFDDWDDEEWQRFDNFMIQCSQYYLENGLKEHKFRNLKERKFIKETHFDFYEWIMDADECPIPFNTRIDKKEYYQKFIDEYPDFFKMGLKQNTFTKWLDTWSKFKGYEIEKGKTNGKRWISVLNKDNFDNRETPFDDE